MRSRCGDVGICGILAWSLMVGCGHRAPDEAAKSAKSPPDAARTVEVAESPTPARIVPSKPLPPLKPDQGAHTGGVLWALGWGNTGRDNGRALAIDSNNRIAVGGLFSEKVVFGPEYTLQAQGTDGYIAVFSAEGTLDWAARVGGSGQDVVSAVAFGPDGDLYVAGWFSGTMTVGRQAVESVGADDVFVARFSAQGQPRWIRSFGGVDIDAADALAVDQNGDVVVTGVFRQTIKVGPRTLTSAGRSDIFLARLRAGGEHMWAIRMGGFGIEYARDIAISQQDIIFLGEYSGTLRFASGVVKSRGDRDVLLCRFDRNGGHRWAKGFGGPFPELAFGLAVDVSGHIVLSGGFHHQIDFGGEIHKAVGESDIFLTRLNGEGGYLWSKSFGSNRRDNGLGVDTDEFGNIVATGFFQGKVNFGAGVVQSAGNKDIFAIKFSPRGRLLWTRHFGGKDHDQGRALAIDSAGRIVVTGTFRFDVRFGETLLRSIRATGDRAPKGDVFVTRIGR